MPTQLMLLPLLSLLRCYCCCFLVRIITQGTPLAAVLAPTLSVTAIALLALACVTAAWRRSRVSACAHGKPDVPPASTAPPASTNVGAAMHKKAAPGFSSNNVTLVLTDVQVWVHAAAHLLLHALSNLAYMSSQNPMPCQAKTIHKGHVQTPSFLLTKPSPPPHTPSRARLSCGSGTHCWPVRRFNCMTQSCAATWASFMVTRFQRREMRFWLHSMSHLMPWLGVCVYSWHSTVRVAAAAVRGGPQRGAGGRQGKEGRALVGGGTNG